MQTTCRRRLMPGLVVLFGVLGNLAVSAEPKAPRDDASPQIPVLSPLEPAPQEPVFAVVSKQGMRILLSRDDGQTWRQVYLGSEDQEDGGWHGHHAVYGMAYTEGVIAAFSGWGKPGHYIGTVDGKNWGSLLPPESRKDQIWAWSAAAGKGVMLTSASQWQPMAIASEFTNWRTESVKPLLDGGKTHHMVAGYGNYNDGTFVVVGDEQHVFYSQDLGTTWQHSRIPAEAGKGQDAVVYGNGVFLCSFPDVVARSSDGGKTWTLHPHGIPGRLSWRGLSFVRNEFWLTSRNGKEARRSRDGISWHELPAGTPGGSFLEAETGTIINIERNRYDIRRSTDGQNWTTVFQAPQQDVTWSLSLGVYGRIKSPE